MHRNENWAVAVFECEARECRPFLIGLSKFLESIPEIKSYHYLIRGQENNNPIFSLRIFRDSKNKKEIKGKLEAKLKELDIQRLEVDPETPTEFWERYNKWTPITEETITGHHGKEGWKVYCDALHSMSKFVIDLAKKNWFTSKKRVEMAHLMAWTLGCSEAWKRYSAGIFMGYLDRIDGEHHPYLRVG